MLGDVTRTLKGSHHPLTLVPLPAPGDGSWGRAVGLQQDWGCGSRFLCSLQGFPRTGFSQPTGSHAGAPVSGILTLSRISCQRDFSLAGRRAATLQLYGEL